MPCASWIAVSGTAPLDDDGKTAHMQTRCCLQIMARAIEEPGGSIRDVIRTRIMLTDIRRWQEAARAHGELFGEVARFIDPEWLVETEADCVVREP